MGEGGLWSTGCLNGCFLSLFQLLFFPPFFNEEFKFQARRSWPLCSSPAVSRRGGGPVAQNKRPHRLRRCRRAGAPVCRPAGQTGSSTSSWLSCLGGLPGDTYSSTPPPLSLAPAAGKPSQLRGADCGDCRAVTGCVAFLAPH